MIELDEEEFIMDCIYDELEILLNPNITIREDLYNCGLDIEEATHEISLWQQLSKATQKIRQKAIYLDVDIILGYNV